MNYVSILSGLEISFLTMTSINCSMEISEKRFLMTAIIILIGYIVFLMRFLDVLELNFSTFFLLSFILYGYEDSKVRNLKF